MSIERQYSLPNCRLTLFGWSEAGDSVMSVLSNVECHIAGEKLTGGRDFFEGLVWTVSYYAQEIFSGVHCPQENIPGPKSVHLEKSGTSTHRLSLKPGEEEKADNPTEVKLTDVQLFDLVEAIDQIFADNQTLPDLSWRLTPTSKRYVKSAIPVAQQAAPATLGIAGVAFAAAFFFMMPIPMVERPTEIEEVRQEEELNSEGSGTESSQPRAGDRRDPPSAESRLSLTDTEATSEGTNRSRTEREAVLDSASSINDPTKITILNRRLHEDIDRAWENRDELDRDLTYRVAVGQDGAILGYKPGEEDTGAEDEDLTPLVDLVYIPTSEGGVSAEAIAEFKVVFREAGIVEVSPWNGFPPESQSLGPEITDPFLLENLNQELYSRINEAQTSDTEYQAELNYRVAVQQDGEIIDYEALNQAAFDYLDRTPLPNLLDLESGARADGQALSNRPLAQFKVVFTPDGVLQVSPWRGIDF